MKTINWGIIGCGDVAEVKSGPAFYKEKNSSLKAVMRRNGEKAKDFAKRHNVSFWYDNADELLSNEEINSVYIATPPSSHLKYTMDALKADKNVYLEKPMALNLKETKEILESSKKSKGKLTIAHYRRKLPAFLKVKALIDSGVLGEVLLADIQILQPKKSNIIANTEDNWRLNPSISGGGYFQDIAPHQIDLMYYYFGDIINAKGFASTKRKGVQDMVNGILHFKNGIQFRGIWNFISSEQDKKDECIIYGTKGRIIFSFYGNSVTTLIDGSTEVFTYENPPHVQQPMIASTISYFLGLSDNPCPAEDGVLVMEIMEKLFN